MVPGPALPVKVDGSGAMGAAVGHSRPRLGSAMLVGTSKLVGTSRVIGTFQDPVGRSGARVGGRPQEVVS